MHLRSRAGEENHARFVRFFLMSTPDYRRCRRRNSLCEVKACGEIGRELHRGPGLQEVGFTLLDDLIALLSHCNVAAIQMV